MASKPRSSSRPGSAKSDPKGALDAQDQLGSPETVNAEITIKLTGPGDIDMSSRLLIEFSHQFAHDGNQRALAGLFLGRVEMLAAVGLCHGRCLARSLRLLLIRIKRLRLCASFRAVRIAGS